MKHKTTEAQRRATANYTSKHERINCLFELGTLERIKNTGMDSASAFIRSAVLEKLEKLESIQTEK